MEQHKDRGESLPVLPATAVLMATWRLIRPIACATLVACHASTSASIPCACHISVGGKQLRRSTRCVGCVRGANFFRNAHRHTRARWLSPGFFFFFSSPPNAHQPSPVPYYATARSGGLQEIKRYVHQQPHPLHFRAVSPPRLAPLRQFSQPQSYLGGAWQPARALK